MGVKDLMSLLKKHAPNSLQKSCSHAINNIWIDTPLLVMASAKRAEMDGQNAFDLLHSTLKKTVGEMKSLNSNAHVYFVFDGKTRREKQETVSTRCIAHDKYSARALKSRPQFRMYSTQACLHDTQTILNMFSSHPIQSPPLDNQAESYTIPSPSYTCTTPKELSAAARQWLTLIKNVSVVQAESDSEDHIARHMGKHDLAVTVDSDALAFGCSHVLQNYGKPTETWIWLDDVLQELQCTMQEFKTLCVLLGNDFNSRIPMCGPVTCFNSMKHTSLEEFARIHSAPAGWIEKARATYAIFGGPV